MPNVDISRSSYGHISVLRKATVTSLGMLVVLHVLCMLTSLTRSKVKVKITGLLNFRQLAKPCMLAAITEPPCGAFWFVEYALTQCTDSTDNNICMMWVTQHRQECRKILQCGPMPNVMVALPNIGGTLCSTLQSLADAHY